MHLLWAFEEVQEAIRQVAKSIDDLYSENQTVNLVPVLTGAMPFCSGLAMELERLTPGKWCIVGTLDDPTHIPIPSSTRQVITEVAKDRRSEGFIFRYVLYDLCNSEI
jgi:hypothetical protein